MEHLTKQQIVLVTLLVSFVTSIATGIVTVSLMDQAPPGISQTINRVVERTIERVVQAPTQQAAAVVTKETVVVKEDDRVVAAIERTNPSLVRVLTAGPSGEVVALGLIISKEGVVAVDAKHFNSETDYVARLADGKMYPLTPLTKIKDEQTGGEQVALFNIAPPEGVVALEPSFTPAVLADSDKIKLGQTVVFIGGDETNTVATGLVSNIQYEKIVPKDASTTPIVSKKVAAISTSGEVASKTGGVLVNLSSEVVALGLVRDSIHFLPSNSLSTLLVEYLASSTPEKATAAVSP